ncbi:MAG: hypothetical protein HJJLKODD_01968 [Phycisphaerae bacterium]|nr:hypothetical protein [Phycisphaerae bacterium]
MKPLSAGTSRWRYVIAAMLFLGLAAGALAQSESQPSTMSTTAADESRIASAPAGGPAASIAEVRSPVRMWVLLPPLLAIILAIVTRQVLPALAVAVLLGGFMMLTHPNPSWGSQFAGTPALLLGFRVTIEHYLIGALTNHSHMQVILFTMLIGGMVGVLSASGATRALVQLVSRQATNNRRGQLMGWIAGLLIFFDDYANAMIIGPTMTPIFDKLKISRQKLAYICDATAAPVASLALIGTWIGAEIGFIQDGLKNLGTDRPEFLTGLSAYQIFLYSIPYRFYAIFAILLGFIIAFTGRDFGPMLRYERRAAADGDSQAAGLQFSLPATGKWWYAGVPILVLVFVTLVILGVTGWMSRDISRYANAGFFEKLGEILHNADAYGSILYGAILALTLALVISWFTKSLNLRTSMEAFMEGMNRVLPAIVVLVLAWSLSSVLDDKSLGLAFEARYLLSQEAGVGLDPTFLPMIIFLLAAGVSFATGTSWGTMGILCPVAVTVAASLVGDLANGTERVHLFYATVGAVLAGSVFGDHCSPISDTTILSAIASGCSLESHVWTQMPYALLGAIVALGCGDLLTSHYHQPWWVGWLAGIGVMLIVVLVVGRRSSRPSVILTLPHHE